MTIPISSSSEGNNSGEGERDGAGNNVGAFRSGLVSGNTKSSDKNVTNRYRSTWSLFGSESTHGVWGHSKFFGRQGDICGNCTGSTSQVRILMCTFIKSFDN